MTKFSPTIKGVAVAAALLGSTMLTNVAFAQYGSAAAPATAAVLSQGQGALPTDTGNDSLVRRYKCIPTEYGPSCPDDPKPATVMEESDLIDLVQTTKKPLLLTFHSSDSDVVAKIDDKEYSITVGADVIGSLKQMALQNKQHVKFKTVSTWPMGDKLMYGALACLLGFGAYRWYKNSQQQGAAQHKASTMGKSKARRGDDQIRRVTYADVAGQDEAKESLQEVVAFLRDPNEFIRGGAKIPRGVMMDGGPGLGKTLLARATAGEANVPFFTISGSDFVEMFVGVGASRVRDMFEEAKKVAPCIIFIDEIDAVGKTRGGAGGGNDEREQTLNQLLVEMDGFDDHSKVVLIGATNRLDTLDPALLRPGRFDRKVTLRSPDRNGRKALFTLYLNKIMRLGALDPEVLEMVDHWAKVTTGMSGADIDNAVNEAAIKNVLRRRKGDKASMLNKSDMVEGIQDASMGRKNETQSKIMTEQQKRSTAYHEGAGHCIVSIEVGEEPGRATIMPRGHSLGHYMPEIENDGVNMDKKKLLGRLAVAMAGRAAQWIYFQEEDGGCEQDLKMAHQLANYMVKRWGMSDLGPISVSEDESERMKLTNPILAAAIHDEVMKFVNGGQELAESIILKLKREAAMFSEALLENETMNGPEIKELWNALKSGDFSAHRLSVEAQEKADIRVNQSVLPKRSNELPVVEAKPAQPRFAAAVNSVLAFTGLLGRRQETESDQDKPLGKAV